MKSRLSQGRLFRLNNQGRHRVQFDFVRGEEYEEYTVAVVLRMVLLSSHVLA